ncbi:hypothetical protein EGT07_08290 [Herbaspirillum sp. HC18]|nr:hypothetical protein EGT07_08290 [Herbaspirillum sp. HC18]
MFDKKERAGRIMRWKKGDPFPGTLPNEDVDDFEFCKAPKPCLFFPDIPRECGVKMPSVPLNKIGHSPIVVLM